MSDSRRHPLLATGVSGAAEACILDRCPHVVVPLQADGAVPAKRHSSGEPAAPAAPCPAASAEQLALQQLLMAGPASLLQAQAAGLGGVLPSSYAGFMGFPGYVGMDTLLSGQARAIVWH